MKTFFLLILLMLGIHAALYPMLHKAYKDSRTYNVRRRILAVIIVSLIADLIGWFAVLKFYFS